MYAITMINPPFKKQAIKVCLCPLKTQINFKNQNYLNCFEKMAAENKQ